LDPRLHKPGVDKAQRGGLEGRGSYEGWHASTLLCRSSALHAAGPMPEIPLGEFIAWYGVAQSAGLQSSMISDVLVKRRMHLQNTTRGLEDRNGYLKAAKMVLDSKRARGRALGA